MTDAAPRRTLALAPLTVTCLSDKCQRAKLILETAHASASALLKAYELARAQRGRPRGMTTDNEQDLLRSMLVMTAAGLDAIAKQLITDALPSLLDVDDKAQNSFEKFLARRLGSDSSSSVLVGARLLAAALATRAPQARLIQEYVGQLVGGSLQSTDSLFEVAAALGVDPASIHLDPARLRPIFETRNRIIHELDINLNSPRRTRNVRSQQEMIRGCEHLFRLASALVASVDKRLSRARTSA